MELRPRPGETFMNPEKYDRSVTLLCPTCGSSQFSQSAENEEDSALMKCASCGREITKDELIRENSENIAEHVDEIKEQVVKDVRSELQKSLAAAFKGNKHIKIKL